jgi:Ran GTPase-activating protein (RanGAP) involved in mRNA processing and transport
MEHFEIAKALTQSTAVTSLQLDLNDLDYSAKAAEAMGEYIRSSIHLRSVYLYLNWNGTSKSQRALSILLRALQDSTSVKELRLFRRKFWSSSSELGGSRDLTSLILMPNLRKMDIGEGYEVGSFPAKNETLQDLTLTNSSPSSLTRTLKWLGSNCPTLKTLCIKLCKDDLTGLATLLESNNSNITELVLDGGGRGHPSALDGLETVLRALERKNTLTKLEMRSFPLSLDQARHLQIVLRNLKHLQTLVLQNNSLGSAHLAEIAAALEQHMSIKTLDLSVNNFGDMDSAVILRNIIHVNKTIAKLDLSYNSFGRRPEAMRCIAMGLRRSVTLLQVNLAGCQLGNQGVSILAETLFSRDGGLQKLSLGDTNISFTSFRPLVDAMIEHESQITHLALLGFSIGDEGASYLANALADNALPHLICLSGGGFGDDGLVNLASALETNQSLSELDLSWFDMGSVLELILNGRALVSRVRFSERGFLALANSLPEIRKLKRIHFKWCPGLLSAMPSLVEGLRDNTSVVQFNITKITDNTLFGDDPYFPLTEQDTAKYDGGWMKEIQYLGFRNRFISMIRVPLESAPPLGLWAPALAKVSKLPGVLFYVLRSKAALVPSGIAR